VCRRALSLVAESGLPAGRFVLVGRRVATLVGSAVALITLIAASSGIDGRDRGPTRELRAATVGGKCGKRPFHVGNWPPACYRPFAAKSPFNRPLPGGRSYLRSRSQPAITGPVTQSRVGNFSADPRGGGEVGVYYSRPTDPEFVLNCVHDEFGRPDHGCAIDGRKLRIPAGARPEDNRAIVVGQPRTYDAHLVVVDQKGGWEYDLWQVQSTSSFASISGDSVNEGLRASGGRVDFSWGGRTRLAGTGSAVDRPAGEPVDGSNAASWAETAGRVRAEELAAGRINHALFLNVPCTAPARSVYPAHPEGRAFACSGNVRSDLGVLPLGTRIWLDMTSVEITDLPIPAWKKVFLRALSRYGGYIGDTNADPRWLFYIETEGGNMYSSPKSPSGRSYQDRWYRFAKENGWPVCAAPDCVPGVRVGKLYRDPPRDDYDYAANVWPKLRVMNRCVTPRPGRARC
jgi:hypothetical protein